MEQHCCESCKLGGQWVEDAEEEEEEEEEEAEEEEMKEEEEKDKEEEAEEAEEEMENEDAAETPPSPGLLLSKETPKVKGGAAKIQTTKKNAQPGPITCTTPDNPHEFYSGPEGKCHSWVVEGLCESENEEARAETLEHCCESCKEGG